LGHKITNQLKTNIQIKLIQNMNKYYTI